MSTSKRMVYCFLAALLVLTLCIPASAAGERKADVKTGTPTIDGVIDEVWNYADELPLDIIKATGDTPNDGTGGKGTFKVLWDNGKLYVLASIKDSTRNVTGVATYTVDSVEVYLDPLHTVSETYEEGNNFCFTISADGLLGVEGTDKTDTVTYKCVDSKDGYIVEMAIAIASPVPSFKFAAGTIMGFDIQFNDNIDGGEARNHCLGWNDKDNQVWQNPSYMGELKLVDAKAEAAAAEQTPAEDAPEVTAPKTADSSALYVLLVLLAGCAMTVMAGKKSKS